MESSETQIEDDHVRWECLKWSVASVKTHPKEALAPYNVQ